MIVLGVVFILGIGGFSLLSFSLLFWNKGSPAAKDKTETKVLLKEDEFSDRESDLSDHSKVA